MARWHGSGLRPAFNWVWQPNMHGPVTRDHRQESRRRSLPLCEPEVLQHRGHQREDMYGWCGVTISLRPFYLPRKFQQLFYTLVYIFPRAEQSAVSQLISDIKHKLDSLCPEAPKFVLGILITAIWKRLWGHTISMPLFTNSFLYLPLVPPITAAFTSCLYINQLSDVWTGGENSESLVKGQHLLPPGMFECTDWNCFYDACDDVN